MIFRRGLAWLTVLAALLPAVARAQIPGTANIQVGGTNIIGGTSGRCLFDNAGKVGETASCGLAGGITIGTSVITGGTTTRVLFDNAGLVGEYVISGSGSVCMTTSCAMTTPSLGAATATTINGAAVDNTAWASFSASATCGNNAITTASSKQKTLGKTVFWEIEITLNATIGTCTNVITFTMPSTAASSAGGGGREIQITGKAVGCSLPVAGTTLSCFLADATSYAASARLMLSGVYESQ